MEGRNLEFELEKLSKEYYLSKKEVLVKESIENLEFIDKFEKLISLGLIEKENTKYIIISPLQSSYLTNTYECVILFCNEEIYLDSDIKYYYIKMYKLKELIQEFSFENLDKEEGSLDPYLKSCICYEMALKFHEDIGSIFSILVSRIRQNKELKSILNDIHISYGKFMERAKFLGEPV
jgi:hypothetical protein